MGRKGLRAVLVIDHHLFIGLNVDADVHVTLDDVVVMFHDPGRQHTLVFVFVRVSFRVCVCSVGEDD
jgi:hypothetical protein